MISTQGPFTGIIPSLPTPFCDDESLDLESLDRLIRFDVTTGVDAITVLGAVWWLWSTRSAEAVSGQRVKYLRSTCRSLSSSSSRA